ncbi:hypothetical protein Sps_03760 [Shewanella psychrophila]|uniref:Membrane anchored protein in chemotaxis locus n=1 Tax=Shewanella psychrophila TaxID=225848 RepID=A0A1S6HTJ4_9GAMM|nr:hypothetical protein [Shewanella psychrophila]AQS38877.1 hypothetical protein Sps_03760 [Shewanella psychrophila]
MAKSQRKLSTSSVLIISLLTIGVFISSSLYLDIRHKNELLLLEIERLQQSQVLLMVPDEQAQALASWMAQHPEATQALLSQVKQGEKVTLEVGPGVNSTNAQVNSPVASPLALGSDDNTQLSASKSLEQVPSALRPLEQMPSESVFLEQRAKSGDGTHKHLHEQDEQAISLIANDLSLDEPSETLSNLAETLPKGSTLSVDEDGVKVISLPHGGIRVTTRENN